MKTTERNPKPAQELKPGETFTLTTRKNAHQFTISAQHDAVEIIGGPGAKWNLSEDCKVRGKLLIIMANCRQLTVEPDMPVYVL
jgi:hypothetical protein